MPEFLALRGRNALSDFRVRKLLSSTREVLPGISSLTAEYWHFVETQRDLSADERRALQRILDYGPVNDAVKRNGRLFLVVPRFGTISPWSSKATDIARSCGLQAVRRIERGVAWYAQTRGKRSLGQVDAEVLLPLIHDRMTETCLADFPEDRTLFAEHAPRPLRTVWPSTRASPASGEIIPSSMRMVVVLPAPLSPKKP